MINKKQLGAVRDKVPGVKPRTPLGMALACLLAAPTAGAMAEEEITIAHVVTCTVQADNETFSKASRVLKAHAAKKGDDGPFVAVDRVQAGELCIENVKVGAAFGVLMSMGTLCRADSRPLVEFVQREQSGLTPTSLPPDPSVLEMFAAPKYQLAVFKGEGLTGDPESKRISYNCAYQATGAQ
ncbi:hypothetical protein GJV26_28540 [Massilia dura]|uniref:Uncharacterized protein n=1 Tax=Pseudoduganella dura TaxID=321982 RepID=A0A6I3XX86_9BURK|nr:hypothetical protein [Pseudoduganella dura]MUI16375.1 hypothetical protein [Pseudoduganella dura]GGX86326.1 hypothetical protein GCM10007386_16420 [Pseudoduganella dura]